MWLAQSGNKLNNAESLFAQMRVPHRTGKQPASLYNNVNLVGKF